MIVPAVMDAGFITAVCFLFAILVSNLIDRIFPDLDTQKSRARLLTEASLEFAVIGMVLYIARKFISEIRIPGFTLNRPDEIRSLPILVFIFMFFQKKLQAKVNYIIT
jgi:membrane protein insertase Oxa1/YidC/SpoIIIJ